MTFWFALKIRILHTTVSILKIQHSWVWQSAAQYIISQDSRITWSHAKGVRGISTLLIRYIFISPRVPFLIDLLARVLPWGIANLAHFSCYRLFFFLICIWFFIHSPNPSDQTFSLNSGISHSFSEAHTSFLSAINLLDEHIGWRSHLSWTITPLSSSFHLLLH